MDEFFDNTTDDLQMMYKDRSELVFRYTSKADLNTTHRFGQNLADALGNNVYNKKLKSYAEEPLDIEIINAHIDSFPTPRGKPVRQNPPEADMAVKYVRDNNLKEGQFEILTPYRDRLYFIRNKYSEFKESANTIHSSQGREWDTVIISIVDGIACNEEKPPRLTSTATGAPLVPRCSIQPCPGRRRNW